MPFHIGESVARLGTWEPQMTVESVEGNIVMCVWVDDAGQRLCEKFASNQLEPWYRPHHHSGNF